MKNDSWILFSLAAVAVLGALGVAPLRAENVEAGIDAWGTPEGSSTANVDFPAGFFGVDSDALGNVGIELRGKPLPTESGSPSLGYADTVVRRLDPVSLSCGVSKQTRVQIVALSLESTAPITVTYGGSRPELWDVKVCLSDDEQTYGSMIISQNCADGGTYSSDLPVCPKFVFTRRVDGEKIILDTCTISCDECLFACDDQTPCGQLSLEMKNGAWVHSPESGLEVLRVEAGAVTDGNCDGLADLPLPATSNFAAGVSVSPCSCFDQEFVAQKTQQTQMTAEDALWAEHTVEPATPDDVAYAPGYKPWEELENAGADRLSLAGAAVMPLLVLAFAFAVVAPRKRRPKDETGGRS